MSNLTRVSVLEGSNKIRDGEMVIFPRESVYGLGSNWENESAVKNLEMILLHYLHLLNS
jgi:tRNA A37 threonylcarbamoyladenosine synthetase subunit TsaC/SUA5/YrdC